MTTELPPGTTPAPTSFLDKMPFDIFSASYAILVATGGVLGYVKAKSVPSLAAGLTFGALIGTGSYLESQGNYWLTYASSGVLGAMMTQRFLKSRKFMPSGLVSVLSIGMFIRYSVKTYIDYSQKGQDPSAPSS